MNWINSEIARIKKYGRWTDLLWPGYWGGFLVLYLVLDRPGLIGFAAAMILADLAAIGLIVTIRELRAENQRLKGEAKPVVDKVTVYNIGGTADEAQRAAARLEKINTLRYRG